MRTGCYYSPKGKLTTVDLYSWANEALCFSIAPIIIILISYFGYLPDCAKSLSIMFYFMTGLIDLIRRRVREHTYIIH